MGLTGGEWGSAHCGVGRCWVEGWCTVAAVGKMAASYHKPNRLSIEKFGSEEVGNNRYV